MQRRSFFKSLAAGGAGILAAPHITFRGHETLLAQSAGSRRADRLLSAAPGVIRIDSNENPNGPGERVFAVIRAHLSESNRYPVRAEDALQAAIAKTHPGVQAENVILGSGSGELLRAAVSAFCTRDRGIVVPEPTFEAPASWAKFLGAPIIAPKVTPTLHADLDAMVEQGKGAGLVYLCNPNNPTATVHSKADIVSYIEHALRLSPDTTILVDEAYFEYVDDPGYGTVIPVAMANPRVVVARTFSKVFGMAGLRVGYAVGQPATLAKMAAWLLGSNVSQLTLVAAAAAVGDQAHIAADVRKNKAMKAATIKFFESKGYKPAATQANFLMVDIGRDAKQFKADCLKQKIAVGRQFASLPNHTRISFGTASEMQKAFRVFSAVLAAPAARGSS